MLLFSKRHRSEWRYPTSTLRSQSVHLGSRENSLLDEATRIRLQYVVQDAIESNKYFEPFLITHNKIDNVFYLNQRAIENISKAELGYNLSRILDCMRLSFDREDYSDVKFFDLIEMLIIFCKEEQREDFKARLQNVFTEEVTGYKLHDFMITKESGSSLRSVMPLISNPQLKSMLTDYYRTSNEIDEARISAGIVQYLFSSPDESTDTKTYSEQLCSRIANHWAEAAKSEELAKLLSSDVKNAKEYYNQIGNVRHTDRTTIQVEGIGIYKMIASKNMAIAGLVIFTLPEEFIISQQAKDLKQGYLQSNRVNANDMQVIRDISPDEIPF